MVEVSKAACSSDMALERQSRWGAWLSDGIVRNIMNSQDEIETQGFSVTSLMERAGGRIDPEESRSCRQRKIRKNFQGTVTKALTGRIKVDPVARTRFKLTRWNLSGLPGATADAFLKSMDRVKQFLPPKVASGILRTAWNGWCTKDRFQQSGPCLFGCGSFTQADSLEHYAGCSVCVGFLRKHLHVRGAINRGHLIVLGANSGRHRDEDIVRLAVWAYVLYKTFNHIRHRQGMTLSTKDLESYMASIMWEGVAGHEQAERYLRACWDEGARLSAQDSDSSDESWGLA